MPAEGICLRVTHTGLVNGSLLVTDIHDGIDANGRVQSNKPGVVYIPDGGTVDLVYTTQVALSFETGAIRQWITQGALTAAFFFGAAFEDSVSATGSIVVADEGVTVENEATTLNFIGGNITATSAAPGSVDVTVVGAGGAIVVEDNGVLVEAAATLLDFGAGVSAVSTGAGQVELTAPPAAPWNVTSTAVDVVAASRDFILVTGAAVVITLPAPALNAYVGIKVVAPVITNIEVRTNAAGVLIDGTDYSAVGLPLAVQWEQINVLSDGVNWFIW